MAGVHVASMTNMKKDLVLIIAVFLWMNTAAQHGPGFRAGINISDITGSFTVSLGYQFCFAGISKTAK